MKKQVIEKLIEIASRIPPSDRWGLIDDPKNIIYNSLTDVLEAYYTKSTIKPIAFRLELSIGKIYAIVNSEEVIEKPKPKKLNIYGEFE